MRVTVRLFARLRDVTGTGELIREVPPDATARHVWDDLVLEWPRLREYEKTMSVAVNAEYARMTAEVHDGDEVAFMPPVSGGSAG
jgi:molybdopterin converting factor subunit 1